MITLRFVLFRLLAMLLVLAIIATLTFIVFYVMPANPAQLSCGRPCTAANMERAEEFMGTDLPWWQQLGEFVQGIATGRSFGSDAAGVDCSAPCFGYSFQRRDGVTQLITERFPLTASIAVGAAVLWLVVGVATGMFAALRRGTAVDRAVMTMAIAGVSVPVYVVGLLAILLFGFTLGWFPTGGYVPFTESPVEWFRHLVLPWCTLAFVMAPAYSRLTRTEMLEVMSQDHVRTARAKGVNESGVVLRHGLRNALMPIVTVFGLDLGVLLGGTVIIESVFSMQGLGALFIDGVNQLDLQLVVGFTLFSAFLIVVTNFVIDLIYGIVDPRVRAAA